MGDRANVYIKDSATEGVFLYTHWGGDELPEVVREALDSDAGRGRWNDGSYLARIVFCRMVKGDEASATGYGISSRLGDNTVGRPIIVLDPDKQRIGFAAEAQVPQPVKWQSFEEYAAAQDAKWPSG